MTNQTDWQKIFSELKTNIRIAIKPHLKTIKEPLPNLGIGAGGDAMKPVDLSAENAIVDTLSHHKLSFTLISEESGCKQFGSHPDYCYVTVDPIDGTTNLMHGLPFYASSIAVSGKPQLASVYAGMVVDLHHDVAYTAFLGEGAYCNGERISTSKTTSLDEALVGIDLNAYRTKLPAHIFAALYENIKHTRHFGANAPEVCFVAAGLTDAFIDLRNKIRTTDVAAGFLILKEAGGVVTDGTGKLVNVPLDPKQTLSFVASGNPEIHQKILNLVKSDV
jgi:fructose-1,6-bisphosphatase/inositol monophosphatase family enzyme